MPLQDNERLAELLAKAEQAAEGAACNAVRARAAAADARAELQTRPAVAAAYDAAMASGAAAASRDRAALAELQAEVEREHALRRQVLCCAALRMVQSFPGDLQLRMYCGSVSMHFEGASDYKTAAGSLNGNAGCRCRLRRTFGNWWRRWTACRQRRRRSQGAHRPDPHPQPPMRRRRRRYIPLTAPSHLYTATDTATAATAHADVLAGL